MCYSGNCFFFIDLILKSCLRFVTTIYYIEKLYSQFLVSSTEDTKKFVVFLQDYFFQFFLRGGQHRKLQKMRTSEQIFV